MNVQLKIRIYEKFYSQANFAQMVGVDESVVSRVVRGRRKLNDEHRRQWAAVLGCDTSIFEKAPSNGKQRAEGRHGKN